MAYTLGLGGSCFHDGSACLVDDSARVVAFVEEERLTRRRHNIGSRSCSLAARWCLHHAGITPGDVDEVAIGWNPAWPEVAERSRDRDLIRSLLHPRHFGNDWPPALTVVEHHLAHAASAFYLSGFSESAVLVVDGAGDGTSTSLYRGTPSGLQQLARFPYTQSLGWFYESVGEYLGLGDGTTSAGKLMGLAAYGTPRVPLDFISSGGGTYRIDLSRWGVAPRPDAAERADDPAYFRSLKAAYDAAFESLGFVRQRGRGDGFTRDEADLAASAQVALQTAMLALSRRALAESASRHLCLAGGVAFNCAANGLLHRESGARALFVQPVAGDAGCAIGAALEAVRRRGRLVLPGPRLVSAGLGPAYADSEIAAVLDHCKIGRRDAGDHVAEVAAAALACGAIVGWFQGRCEAGPRALGHRSILADPRRTEQRERINRDVKQREPWRPLAPSIAQHARDAYIEERDAPADFMNVACRSTPHARSTIAATVHVDGSMRPQVVVPERDPPYADLLRAFERETGVPALLNTSFNGRGEPIVCSPLDAIRTFYSTPLDMLCIGGFIVTK
jgi:carbamoyltransferase